MILYEQQVLVRVKWCEHFNVMRWKVFERKWTWKMHSLTMTFGCQFEMKAMKPQYQDNALVEV